MFELKVDKKEDYKKYKKCFDAAIALLVLSAILNPISIYLMFIHLKILADLFFIIWLIVAISGIVIAAYVLFKNKNEYNALSNSLNFMSAFLLTYSITMTITFFFIFKEKYGLHSEILIYSSIAGIAVFFLVYLINFFFSLLFQINENLKKIAERNKEEI